AEAGSARSIAFGREGLKNVARALDPCVAQPIVEIARSETELGKGAIAVDDRTWARQFELGLGLLHSVQERLGDPRSSLELALEAARTESTRAITLGALAQVAANQGRTQDALTLADRAEVLVPKHPALARIRGEALAATWRWNDAAPWFL